MNKKFKSLSLLTSAFVVGLSAVLITTASLKSPEKKVCINTYLKNITASFADQIGEFWQEIKASPVGRYIPVKEELIKNLQDTIKSINIDNVPQEFSTDPSDLLQLIMALNKDKIMVAINIICNALERIPFIFDKDSVEAFKTDITSVLDLKIRLGDYIKANWNLTTLYEDTLFKIFDKEKAWKVINAYYPSEWYSAIDFDFKTGTFLSPDQKPKLSKIPKYEKFDYSQVRPGDIMFSSLGFFNKTGHCGVIDGWKTDANGVRYLSMVEAIKVGVAHSVIDDESIINDHLSILRVNEATDEQAQIAADFNVSQIGKPYVFPIVLTEGRSADETAWYCSEITWASYINQGINIKSNTHYPAPFPGILPWEIYYHDTNIAIVDWQKEIVK